MFDATDLEIARREHLYELGMESAEERRWSKWVLSAALSLVANGWSDTRQGLDGDETADGFSLDYVNEAFERGDSVQEYVAAVGAKRAALGLN